MRAWVIIRLLGLLGFGRLGVNRILVDEMVCWNARWWWWGWWVVAVNVLERWRFGDCIEISGESEESREMF